MKKRTIVITNALTYANGSLHLGHAVGYIQSDIWARFQKMRGHTVIFVGGSDCHGTPIMLKALEQDLAPETMVADIALKQKQAIDGLLVELDHFDSTHTETNREFTEMIFSRLNEGGHISKKTIEQAFDPEKQLFLPDRFIKGTCPRCRADDQYGDSCEVCGATYRPTELKNPVSVLSGKTPITKKTEHYFFALNHFEKALSDWMSDGHLQPQVVNKLEEWFEQGLRAWDISRDAPYFGFTIPGTDDKYFYVWMDAPIGYFSALKHVFDQNPALDFNAFLEKDSEAELYHFVGKDIVYFHALFWPAMLMGANLHTPKAVFTHGFLTVGGQKMSKSRGTFINVNTYLAHLPAEALRYYFASKINDRIEDMDINFDDFIAKINADLVGKVINLASRSAGFITKKFDGRLSATLTDNALIKQFSDQSDAIAAHYENRQFAPAMREIMRLADLANQYVSEKAPWALAKNPDTLAEVQIICSTALNLFRLLMIYLKPVLPVLSQKAADFLNVDPFTWQDSQTLLLDHEINPFKPMMTRLESHSVEAIIEAEKKT
jgi:methionyl-tRNA synthetase